MENDLVQKTKIQEVKGNDLSEMQWLISTQYPCLKIRSGLFEFFE
jgi:hypothetical protein